MTTASSPAPWDPWGPDVAVGVQGALEAFNRAGVLSAGDVRIGGRLASLDGGGDGDDPVALAAALAVRGVRTGHARIELTQLPTTVTGPDGSPPGPLPWPDLGTWGDDLAGRAVVAVGDDDPARLPLRLVGDSLYLDRYWRYERTVAAQVLRRADHPPDVDEVRLRAVIDGLFGPPQVGSAGPDLQRLATATAALSRLAVVAGGPGTGKTTTVARVLVLLDALADTGGASTHRVALTAPTGRAAARLGQAVRDEAAALSTDRGDSHRLDDLVAVTLHRLLGARPGASRFAYDRHRRLPFDTVVIDEASMVSLPLMAHLLECLRPDARLIAVGDPEQLVSVDVGTVLGDIVGPARRRLVLRGPTATRLAEVTGEALDPGDDPAATPLSDGIVALRQVHRFGAEIGALAAAVVAGDAPAVLARLRAGSAAVRWIEAGGRDPGDGDDTGDDPVGWRDLAGIRDLVVGCGVRTVRAAQQGRRRDAVDALGAVRVLCVRRHGAGGVSEWNDRIAAWMAAAVPGYGRAEPWYPGRPVLVTRNDYDVGLRNGDIGVVCTVDGEAVAVIDRSEGLTDVAPARLDRVETLHAMTVHKSQGSQFDDVVVVLPPTPTPLLTRELLYTAVTRARTRVTIVGSADVVEVAVRTPVTRASGLRQRLWPDEPGG